MEEIVFHTPQEEASIIGRGLLPVYEGLGERSLPVIAETGATPEVPPDDRTDAPDAQAYQSSTTGHAPVIHAIIVRERV